MDANSKLGKDIVPKDVHEQTTNGGARKEGEADKILMSNIGFPQAKAVPI